MQRILTTLTILLLAAAQPALAVRVLELLERSHELSLAEVTLPRSAGGNVTFRSCDECAVESIPVTASTRYFLRDQEVTLSQLNEQAQLVRQPSATPALLMLHYDINTKRATRVVLKTYQVR